MLLEFYLTIVSILRILGTIYFKALVGSRFLFFLFSFFYRVMMEEFW